MYSVEMLLTGLFNSYTRGRGARVFPVTIEVGKEVFAEYQQDLQAPRAMLSNNPRELELVVSKVVEGGDGWYVKVVE